MARPSGQRLNAACRCGQTTIELTGAPILSAVCCCNDCRTAGRQFEQAPGAPPVVGPDGGTPYSLYRKDRVRIALGRGHLRDHRLDPSSPTRRVVAACCNSPMFLDFTKGCWLSVYRDRLGSDAPPLEMRVMAKDAPEGSGRADDIPTYPKFPPAFMIKLLGAWAAMGFRRPEVAGERT